MFVLGVSSSKVQELQMDGVGDTRLDAGWAREIHGIGHVSSNGVGSYRLALILVAVADPNLKARCAIRRVKCSFISFFSLHFCVLVHLSATLFCPSSAPAKLK